VLSDVIWAKDTPFVVPDEYTEPLADAMSAVADILRSIEEESPQEQLERIEAADSAVKALTGRIGAGETATDAPSAAESILMSLHRMLRVVKSSAASD
jgi:hypothetical protein